MGTGARRVITESDLVTGSVARNFVGLAGYRIGVFSLLCPAEEVYPMSGRGVLNGLDPDGMGRRCHK